jgi:hypothetical protein
MHRTTEKGKLEALVIAKGRSIPLLLFYHSYIPNRSLSRYIRIHDFLYFHPSASQAPSSALWINH